MRTCLSYAHNYDGLMAHRLMDPCYSSNLSFDRTEYLEVKDDNNLQDLLCRFIMAFSLKESMASISTGLSVGLKKKKRVMKAKFNRTAYAKSINESIESHTQANTTPTSTHSFNASDYSFHIKETSGRVLTCSELWYK